ncbi:sarcoplasmic calcium-binding protein [Hyalella azteca]|uniref:Sarcoplasmic calcium-binding protein n=1 Tax=Hyalella azteca TaxID=294128 RepID=A0A8B7PCI1_HYAAZ|nr:sarcoplasmic calcium-binding protein [Hyalella azteca]
MSIGARACTALLVRSALHAHRLSLCSTALPVSCALPVNASTAALIKRYYGSKKGGKRYDSGSSSDSDSDSEKKKKKPKKGRRGQSEFWLRKMRTHHVAMDVNKDGVVSWDDFEQMIKRFNETGLLKDEQKQSFEEAVKHVWEEEWGASGDPYAFIGQEQFIANMERAVNSDELRKKIARPLPYFFQAVDHDGSGEISIDEFKLYFKCLGLTEEAAAAAFQAIDINSDGKLSLQEFVKLGRDFFLSEDETRPSKLFWGPLV